MTTHTQDLAVGLTDHEREAAILRKWPHLARPGRGAHNLVAGTFEEQLARAYGPRPAEPYPADVARRLAATITKHSDVLAPSLAECIAPLVGEAIRASLQGGKGAA